jgi:dTDP-4-dehydrorhamnose reductase
MLDRWLVTGASGLLGGNIGRALGHRKTLIGVVRNGVLPAGYHSGFHADLPETEPIVRWIAQNRPDVVVHAAALSSHALCENVPELADAINAQSTQAIAAAASQAGSQFVYVSTDAVFDGQRGSYTETDPPAPFSVYGRSKYLGERLAEQESSVLTLRTNFFGWSPVGSRSILEFFYHALRSGQEVDGFPNVVVSSIYAPTLASILEELVSKQVTGIVHVASRDKLSKLEFGVNVAEQFQFDASLVRSSVARSGPHADIGLRDTSLSTDLVSALLGRVMPTQQDGVFLAHQDLERESRGMQWGEPVDPSREGNRT